MGGRGCAEGNLRPRERVSAPVIARGTERGGHSRSAHVAQEQPAAGQSLPQLALPLGRKGSWKVTLFLRQSSATDVFPQERLLVPEALDSGFGVISSLWWVVCSHRTALRGSPPTLGALAGQQGGPRREPRGRLQTELDWSRVQVCLSSGPGL